MKGENKNPLSHLGLCQIDPKAMLKIYAYFKALGATIEKLSGFITSVVLNMDDEGNGTVLIYTGRLILVNKSIRNAHMFGFKSIELIVPKAFMVVLNVKLMMYTLGSYLLIAPMELL